MVKLPVHHRTYLETQITIHITLTFNLESPFKLTSKSLHCGRKQEDTEESQMHMHAR